MGDVFDAMNRARRERGQESRSPDLSQEQADPQTNAPPVDANDDVSPALPIDQVKRAYADTLGGDETSTSTPVETPSQSTSETFVEAASPPQEDQTSTVEDKPLVSAAAADPAQNGYAPEVVVHHDRGGAITEQYRAIRTQVLARGRNRPLKVHVITSSAPAEGKSVSTVNLGITFSELKNQRTLIMEGDLRRPSFYKLFHRDANPGLLQLLNGEASDINEAIHPTVYPNLDFMPAGGHDNVRSTELLTSPQMSRILEQLKEKYDHIFIDSPPVVSVTDAAILGAMADEVLLVVRLYKTPVEVVDRAKRLLRVNNCDVTGVILTHLKVHMPKYFYRYAYGSYYGYYGYGYGYGYGPSNETAKGTKGTKESPEDTKEQKDA